MDCCCIFICELTEYFISAKMFVLKKKKQQWKPFWSASWVAQLRSGCSILVSLWVCLPLFPHIELSGMYLYKSEELGSSPLDWTRFLFKVLWSVDGACSDKISSYFCVLFRSESSDIAACWLCCRTGEHPSVFPTAPPKRCLFLHVSPAACAGQGEGSFIVTYTGCSAPYLWLVRRFGQS